MMRFECLLERTAEVREKDQMKIRKFEVHAGRTGSVSRLSLIHISEPTRLS